MINRITLTIAACIAFFLGGYTKGHLDRAAIYTAAALHQSVADAKAMADLAAAEEANRMLAQALEDQAYAEPPADSCGLPVSRVLRLRNR